MKILKRGQFFFPNRIKTTIYMMWFPFFLLHFSSWDILETVHILIDFVFPCKMEIKTDFAQACPLEYGGTCSPNLCGGPGLGAPNPENPDEFIPYVYQYMFLLIFFFFFYIFYFTKKHMNTRFLYLLNTGK